MPLRTGTHDISSLLATTNQSAAEFGMQRIQEILDQDLEAHNTLLREALTELADTTLDRLRTYGASAAGELIKVDEYGRGPTQRIGAVAQVAFPLDKFQFPIGWTREWEEERSPADFARATQQAELAHRVGVLAEAKRAIFLSANFNHVDHLVDNIVLPVKRLVNADGAPIPNGPNGEVFDGATHTHYLANASLTTVVADALIRTIIEHGHAANVRVYINEAQETAWRGLAGFVPLQDPRLIVVNNGAIDQPRLDITRLNNRRIGIYGAAEVWVKSWIPSGYAFSFAAGGTARPLVLRERTAGSFNLRTAAEIAAHPMRAQYMECKFGFGVWNRTNGAVLYTGGASYVDPAI